MKFTVDTEVLSKEDLKINDFLYLTSLYFNTPIITKESYNSMSSKGYTYCIQINNDGDPSKIILTQEGVNLVESVLHDSSKTVSEEESIDDLVTKLREIYPKGKKEGTVYMWRDSQAVITKRLKSFFLKFGRFSNEDIINATKKYVESFNGNYTYMHLLKYFIIKKVVVGGEMEETSQLLSYIENIENVDSEASFDEMRYD